ncbi:MAG: hypothetical protein LQ345_003305 [Seirophora villosa]|nr:MAG: hypothetical protein LQ345_003305 [Seirophora villosa]
MWTDNDRKTFMADMRRQLSKGSKVLTQGDPEFAKSNERWTEIDRKTPAVVVQPVKAANVAGVPSVPVTGGHSLWSTIEDGLVIDLSQYKSISVEADQHRVSVRGGVLMKELQLELSKQGQFTTVANGSTVGVIPYVIGGGISSYTPLIGYACENILAARIVVANGNVMVASETENSDLLWAIRGAGQFFGIVTELLLRTYSPALMGPGGIRQLGTLFYPTERASEVCSALNSVVSALDHASSGHFMVMNDPSKGRILMLAPQYFGTEPELQKTFKSMTDLDPLEQNYFPSTFDKHSDHLSWMCSTGDFKRFSQTGLKSINPDNFRKLVDLHQELVETVPGAERSVFTIEWHTKTPSSGARETQTSFGLKDVDTWLNILTWYTNPDIHDEVLRFDQRAQEMMRSDTEEKAFVSYTNTSRSDPVSHRYKDPAAVEKLTGLKRRWDPEGCFTQEFL